MSVRLLQEVQKVAKKLHSVASVMLSHTSHINMLDQGVDVVIIISNMCLVCCKIERARGFETIIPFRNHTFHKIHVHVHGNGAIVQLKSSVFIDVCCIYNRPVF